MAWADATYSYKLEITIDHTKVSGDEVGFPVLVSVTDKDFADTANGGHVQSSNGYDIVFYNSTEKTLFSHEIEKYTNTSGLLIFWVKMPVSSTSDTIFYIYYGKSGVVAYAGTGVTEDTWDANYLMVQHMNESTGNIIDSTSNNRNSTVVGGTPDYLQTGKIGNSIYIGENEGFELSDFARLSTNGNQITVENWVKRVNTGDYMVMVAKYNSVGGVASEWILRFTNVNVLTWYLRRDETDTVDQYITTTTFTDTNNYHYYAAVHEAGDGTKAALYYDGTADATAAWAINGNQLTTVVNYKVSLANLRYAGGWGVQELFGYQDEVRISNIIRSSNWVATTYNSQNSPSTFMSFGYEISRAKHILHLDPGPHPRSRATFIPSFTEKWG